jgi:hypothetical protein
MPFVHRRPGSDTDATIWPPGHMQKLWTPARPASPFATSA